VERLTFAPASSLSLEYLTRAFNRAFTGYYLPMMQSASSLSEMMRENDVKRDISLIASLNNEIVGISLVAIRGDRGWIAGMGIDPVWRAQGLGRQLLAETLTRLRRAGTRAVQLEALSVNTPAIKLYIRAGFHDTRELHVYHGPLHWGPQDARAVEIAAGQIRPVEPKITLRDFVAFHAVQPAWQRDQRTLAHMRRNVSGLGLWTGKLLSAYVIYAQHSAGYVLCDAGAAAESSDARQARIVGLLHHLTGGRHDLDARAINVPPGDALDDALSLLNCPIIARQREMALAFAPDSVAVLDARGDR
jgi:ribosomal protein S18 acetylase RimI-like enzyme